MLESEPAEGLPERIGRDVLDDDGLLRGGGRA